MCVIDEDPHSWQAAELAALATLARAVSNEINLRGSLAEVRLAQILARHTGDWASDDTALLVLRVPPRR
jgi:GAF domain-containing protein